MFVKFDLLNDDNHHQDDYVILNTDMIVNITPYHYNIRNQGENFDVGSEIQVAFSTYHKSYFITQNPITTQKYIVSHY